MWLPSAGGLHGFDEVSPRVDGPSLIETDGFIGRFNHAIGWICELGNNGVGHSSIAVCTVSRRLVIDVGNCTCCSLKKGVQLVGQFCLYVMAAVLNQAAPSHLLSLTSFGASSSFTRYPRCCI
jgi:hypothetical protein